MARPLAPGALGPLFFAALAVSLAGRVGIVAARHDILVNRVNRQLVAGGGREHTLGPRSSRLRLVDERRRDHHHARRYLFDALPYVPEARDGLDIILDLFMI